MLGYSAGELLGPFIWKISAEEEKSRRSALAKLGGEPPPPQGFQRMFRRKDGSTFPVLISDQILKRGDGVITGIRSTIQDITERHQAAEALRRSEIYFRALTDFSLDIVTVLDSGGVIRYQSPSVETVLGWKPEEQVGRNAFDLVHPDDVGAVRLLFESKLPVAGATETREFRYRHKDGSWRMLEAIGSNLLHEPAVAGLVINSRDITGRKQVETELNHERDLWRALLDNSPDKIYFKDTRSRFVKCSQAMATQYGLESTHELVGKTDFDFSAEAQARVAFEDEQEIIRTGQPMIDKEERREWSDGKITWVSSTKMPLRDAAGKIIGIMGISRDITIRKLAEATLLESESMLRESQRIASLGSYVFDIATGLWSSSPMLDSLFGIDAGYERSVANWVALVHPGDRVMMVDHFEKEVLGQHRPFDKEYRIVRHDDLAERWVHGLGKLEFDAKGHLVKMVGTIQDITERRQAEQILRQEQTLLTDLLDSIPDHIYFKDRQSRFIRVNRAMAQHFGLGNPSEALGKTDFDMFSEEHARQAYNDEQRIMETGEPVVGFEEKETWPDGHITWVSTTKMPLRDAAGRITGLVGVSRDVTARRKAGETNARLATAVEQSAESIVITDTQGNILYVNPAFEKVTGYTRAEAIGQNPRILKSGKHDAEFYRQIWQALTQGETWQGHIINRRKNGELFEEDVTFSPVHDEAGKTINYVAVKRDVTHELELAAQYRQSQKMEAFGQLAGGVAHDFNNILAVIQLQAGLLKSEQNLSLKQIEFAGDIEKATERGASLTRQLLLFSRKQTMQPRKLNLKDAIANILRMLQRTLGEQFQLQFKCPEEPVFIHADPGMIDQILLNLTVNARDSMPKGGQIVIETSAVEFDEVTATQDAQGRPGLFVCLSVSDTGCGIAPEILPRIFEPFFTTKGVGKGTGLGLATVFGIVQQHKGWVHVYSEPDRGTTFRVYLPRLTKKESSDTSFFWSSHASVRGGSETILLVEDEFAVRNTVQTTLSRLGYRVLEASTGDEALEVWKQHRSEIRLVLTDLMMPGGMTGIELAKKLLQLDPKLKVIYASGYSAEIAGSDSSLNEGVNFLAKPFQAHKLAQTIRSCLDNN
jgi:PAS domain S-box-containing protein